MNEKIKVKPKSVDTPEECITNTFEDRIVESLNKMEPLINEYDDFLISKIEELEGLLKRRKGLGLVLSTSLKFHLRSLEQIIKSILD